MIRILGIAMTSVALAIASAAAGENPVVLMKTSKGELKIELFADKAPVTVENFLTYVKDGHYNSTIFHRVIPGFMIQGGGFGDGFAEKTTRAPIKNEATNGLKNERGTLAMARTSDPNSATAQFFINSADNTSLDHKDTGQGYGYAVFGKVTDGMAVVDEISKVKTGNKGGHQNVPLESVVIESVTVVE